MYGTDNRPKSFLTVVKGKKKIQLGSLTLSVWMRPLRNSEMLSAEILHLSESNPNHHLPHDYYSF